MRIAKIAFLLLLLCAAPSWSQQLIDSVQKVSVRFRGQVDGGTATVKWTGMGLVSGDMVDMELTNTTNAPVTFRFVPGMVLEDPGRQVQPVLLEENLKFTLSPGETVKRRLRGYCLDYSKEPPAADTEEDYQIATELEDYAKPIKVVYSGLRLDREQKLKPVLRPLVHRTVVIQRGVWAVLGGENPNTEDELEKDLEDEIRYRSAIFPEGQINCLSQRIWADVQRVMAESENEN